MQPSELTIEVRDLSLARVGQIDARLWADVKVLPAFNAVGAWSMSLPFEDPMCQALAQPGAGIIVTGPGGVIMSGPVEPFTRTQTSGDAPGMVDFVGVDDSCVLWDALVWPDPASPAESQTLSHDVRTAAVETLLHQLVNVNIGPGAQAARRGALAQKLTLGTDLGRGGTRTSSARFPVLGELLQSLALLGGLGFRVVQVGAGLEFQTFQPADKSALIRLDVANGLLSKSSYGTQPPAVTRVLVAGQGEGADRTILQRTSTDSLAAETAWGRVREQFKDQRDTNDPTALQQSGDEILVKDGKTIVRTKVTPADDMAVQYGTDWREGDIVTVVVGDLEVPQTVTGAAIGITSDGVMVAAKVGT